MWSTTKVIACVAALQLVEQGTLNINDEVEKYVPGIANIQVMDGKDSDGKIKLRPQKTKATILHCMTHTAGFTYDFFDHDTLAWRIANDQEPSAYLGKGRMIDFETPMIKDPGSSYCYGVNIDWLGFTIEAITGMTLKDYIDKNIIQPLSMTDTTAHFKDDSSRLVVHMRGEDGSLTPAPPAVPAPEPEKYGGGHYLISTLEDYSQFLLTLLNKGTHPISHVKLLEEKTCDDYLFTDMLPSICGPEGLGDIPSSIPQLTGTGRMLPGIKLGWSCGWLLNLEDTPYGRKKGSGQWAGLGNLYYWVDPTAGKLGLIMSSLLPFFDKEVLYLYDALEKAAYGNLELIADKKEGGKGCNYSVP